MQLTLQSSQCHIVHGGLGLARHGDYTHEARRGRELFNPFTGWFFTAMGGSPVNRGMNENKVTAIAEVFNKRDYFRLAIAPEGTRKKVDRWKTGFYHISIKASVPILLVNFNYREKKVSFLKLFYPTGDLNKDLKSMEGFFNKAMQVKS